MNKKPTRTAPLTYSLITKNQLNLSFKLTFISLQLHI